MQDDLVALMSRNMHLSTIQPPAHNVSAPPTPQVVPQSTPITYITQHYHHSTHVAVAQVQEMQATTTLEAAGVNASALLPSQLQLFKNAGSEQRQRLIELWRISPPTFGNQLPAEFMSNWPQTSMDIEEQAARERWEKQEQDRLKTLSMLPSNTAEPYMAQGYGIWSNVHSVDAIADFGAGTSPANVYKSSSDPVYQGREWWNLSDQERMEHQYGMVQQMQMQNYHGTSAETDHEMQ